MVLGDVEVVSPPLHDGGMVIENPLQLAARLAFALTLSGIAATATYVVGLWTLRLVVAAGLGVTS